MEPAPTFHEVQRFRQIWLWLLLGGMVAFCWYAAASQLIFERPVGNHPASDPMMIVIWLIFGVGLPLFILSLRLITEVRGDGIYLRFVPFHFRFVRMPITDIQQCEARTYRPILEYGGWGIRYGLRGKAYNVSGNRGVQLELTNGKRILI